MAIIKYREILSELFTKLKETTTRRGEFIKSKLKKKRYENVATRVRRSERL